MKAKKLLEKLKKLSEKDLNKKIVYCDMNVRKVLVQPTEIELR